MRYESLDDYEGIEIERLRKNSRVFKLHKFSCCDCGLVHDIAFAIEKNGNLGLAAKRNNRATAQLRRRRKFDKR